MAAMMLANTQRESTKQIDIAAVLRALRAEDKG
jgi:hypothetical protein